MGDLLNDLYAPAFYKQQTRALAAVMPSFNGQSFTLQIFTDVFSEYELKARIGIRPGCCMVLCL
jgi:hypothetical protein